MTGPDATARAVTSGPRTSPFTLDQTTAQPFPLVVGSAGSGSPLGSARGRSLTEESLTAYELSCAGTFGGTTAGADRPQGTAPAGPGFAEREPSTSRHDEIGSRPLASARQGNSRRPR